MKLLVAFLPWILFGLLSHAHPMAALLVALSCTAVQVVVHRARPKLLELASLAFFLFAFVALGVFAWARFGRHLGLIVHLLLASIAWGSLAAGLPFTLQYAREDAPVERWHAPTFIRANQWITAVWGTDFLLQAAVLEWQARHGGSLPSVLSAVLTATALALTAWFTARSRRAAFRPPTPSITGQTVITSTRP